MRSFVLVVAFLASTVTAVEQLHFLGSADLTTTADAVATPGLEILQEHYGSPADGCQADEQQFKISGVPGEICAPKCTGMLTGWWWIGNLKCKLHQSCFFNKHFLSFVFSPCYYRFTLPHRCPRRCHSAANLCPQESRHWRQILCPSLQSLDGAFDSRRRRKRTVR